MACQGLNKLSVRKKLKCFVQQNYAQFSSENFQKTDTTINKTESQENRISEDHAKWCFERTISPWQSMSYADQLKKKREFCGEVALKWRNMLVINIRKRHLCSKLLERLDANQGLPFTPPDIIPSPVVDGYRNKDIPRIGRSIDGKPQVGFLIQRNKYSPFVSSWYSKVQKQQHYELQQVFSEALERSDVPVSDLGRRLREGNWRRLQIRSNEQDDVMLTAVVHSPYVQTEVDVASKAKEFLVDFLHGPGRNFNIKSLQFQQSSRLEQRGPDAPYEVLFGEPHIEERLSGCTFTISPDTFFQVNTQAAEVLYENIRQMANLTSNTVLLDVCCGIGTIGVILGKYVGQVIGVELVQQAVDNAIENAERNGVDNAAYICGSAEKYIRRILEGTQVESNTTDIVAVVNPSRSGLGQNLIRALRNCEAIRKVIYISCKPYGRPVLNFKGLCEPPNHHDDKITGPAFIPTEVRALDMFPHTKYFELIVQFER